MTHKINDLLGDLALLGTIPTAHYIGICAGHDLHGRLVDRRIKSFIIIRPNLLTGGKRMKYDINKILDLLPHRYPFLLVDRIEDLVLTDELVEVTGIKNVTINEPFFQGHFPDEPVMRSSCHRVHGSGSGCTAEALH